VAPAILPGEAEWAALPPGVCVEEWGIVRERGDPRLLVAKPGEPGFVIPQASPGIAPRLRPRLTLGR
jgi:hypothetical protein